MEAKPEQLPPIQRVNTITALWYPTKYRSAYGGPSGNPISDIQPMTFGDFCDFAKQLSSEQRRELVELLVAADDEREAAAAADDAADCIQW